MRQKRYDTIVKDGRGQGPKKPKDNTRAIIALVLGILTLFFVWLKVVLLFFAPIIMGIAILGIWLANSNRKYNVANGHSLGLPAAALIVNIISLVISSLVLSACVACTALILT